MWLSVRFNFTTDNQIVSHSESRNIFLMGNINYENNNNVEIQRKPQINKIEFLFMWGFWPLIYDTFFIKYDMVSFQIDMAGQHHLIFIWQQTNLVGGDWLVCENPTLLCMMKAMFFQGCLYFKNTVLNALKSLDFEINRHMPLKSHISILNPYLIMKFI